MSSPPKGWVGRSVRRREDRALLAGRGRFTDDLTLPGLRHAAILRSPHPHARILGMRTAAALALPGVEAVVTGPEIVRASRPFPAGFPTRIRYYSAASDRARFQGEPVAVAVAASRYLAEDACERIEVDYEPLPAVVDQEAALSPEAPLLHPESGSNLANRRLLSYGDPDGAFAEAEVVLEQSFRFHRYSSTPIETCVVMASWDDATEMLTLWSNFHGPFSLHSFVAKGLDLAENRVRLIIPRDIGGTFGIKIGIISYLTLIGTVARLTGLPVKWVEDRREHLAALSSGAERAAHYRLAARRDGTILGVKARYVDNNGAYVRAPEPANLYRTTGNTPGPYRIQHLEIDANAVVTNKSPTGPNRGYGCQQLYFALEGMVDLLARELGRDPADLRLQNLIPPDSFPYRTPAGGLYDSGDYPMGVRRALELADYAGLREAQRRARAEGRLYGVGIALGVEPCASNMGYLNIAFPPEHRAREGFHVKSGAGETAALKVDPMGRVTAIVGSAPSGQGHEVLVAQVVADELDLHPDDITVVCEMDTLTHYWTISSGNYSSRFASTGLSAFAEAARKLRERILRLAAHRFQVPFERLRFAGGAVHLAGADTPLIDLRGVAGLAHWNPTALPEDLEPGLQVTHLFNFPPSEMIDELDRVNSSSTYGFIAEVAAVEIDPATGSLRIDKLVSVHDAGVVINPQRVEGQIFGSVAHGLGGCLYEELAYAPDGTFLTPTFGEYLCPTAMDVPEVVVGHAGVASPFSTLGTKGCGEGSAATMPALLTNAVNDALAPLGARIHELPLTASRVWRAIRQAGGA